MTTEKADKPKAAKAKTVKATVKAEAAEPEVAETVDAAEPQTEETAAEAPVEAAVADDIAPEDRVNVSRQVVDKYAKWSFGIGFIPLPAVDLVALTGVHMKMIHEIAKVYGQSYSNNKIRSTLSALISGAFPHTVGRAGVSSMLKGIPVLGTAISLVTMPVTSAACTYAVGTVFIKHFESGGTLLSIDLSSMTNQAKDFAAKYRKDKGEKVAEEATADVA